MLCVFTRYKQYIFDVRRKVACTSHSLRARSIALALSDSTLSRPRKMKVIQRKPVTAHCETLKNFCMRYISLFASIRWSVKHQLKNFQLSLASTERIFESGTIFHVFGKAMAMENAWAHCLRNTKMIFGLSPTHSHTPAHTHTEHSNAFENVFTLCLKKFIILSLELMPSNLHRTAFI